MPDQPPTPGRVSSGFLLILEDANTKQPIALPISRILAIIRGTSGVTQVTCERGQSCLVVNVADEFDDVVGNYAAGLAKCTDQLVLALSQGSALSTFERRCSQRISEMMGPVICGQVDEYLAKLDAEAEKAAGRVQMPAAKRPPVQKKKTA